MADLAEVPDWRRLWGPSQVGREAMRVLAERVATATGWRPWPIEDETAIDPNLAVWGLVSGRATAMYVLADSVIPDTVSGGWSAYSIEPGDVAEATTRVDAQWADHVAVAQRVWGPPVFAGAGDDPRVPELWRGLR